jgi:hypothetical protein
MHNNSKGLILIVILTFFFIPTISYPASTVYAVIDLPPFGCEPSNDIDCINTVYTQVVADIIDGGASTIQAFPYPRALQMFEKGQSPILVALMNKRLMNYAYTFELYCAEFYLIGMETSSETKTISYLRGADAHKEIASMVSATPFEVNDYGQINGMLRAKRLDFVIIPRYTYERNTSGVFKNAKILLRRKIPIMLYVNKNASQYLVQIHEVISKTSISLATQHSNLSLINQNCKASNLPGGSPKTL